MPTPKSKKIYKCLEHLKERIWYLISTKHSYPGKGLFIIAIQRNLFCFAMCTFSPNKLIQLLQHFIVLNVSIKNEKQPQLLYTTLFSNYSVIFIGLRMFVFKQPHPLDLDIFDYNEKLRAE